MTIRWFMKRTGWARVYYKQRSLSWMSSFSSGANWRVESCQSRKEMHYGLNIQVAHQFPNYARFRWWHLLSRGVQTHSYPFICESPDDTRLWWSISKATHLSFSDPGFCMHFRKSCSFGVAHYCELNVCSSPPTNPSFQVPDKNTSPSCEWREGGGIERWMACVDSSFTQVYLTSATILAISISLMLLGLICTENAERKRRIFSQG